MTMLIALHLKFFGLIFFLISLNNRKFTKYSQLVFGLYWVTAKTYHGKMSYCDISFSFKKLAFNKCSFSLSFSRECPLKKKNGIISLDDLHSFYSEVKSIFITHLRTYFVWDFIAILNKILGDLISFITVREKIHILNLLCFPFLPFVVVLVVRLTDL